ncbi:excinuclease ABC subunit A [Mixta hanseatica]
MSTNRTERTSAVPRQSVSSDIRVHGARTHNLKDVSLSFPRDAMVIFTGVSGSGKSSLAFDTIYAEAQRRYMESIAPHARRLIEQASVPEVDNIDGLPPAVALQQSRAGAQERSTVGSLTRISVTLRLLFSRAGIKPAGIPFLAAEAFSPNNPQGACPVCQGLGRVHEVKPEAMVPDKSLSIREGAIASWPNGWQAKNLRTILDALGYDIDAPWETLPLKAQQWILFTDEQPTLPVFSGLNAEQRKAAIAAGMEPSYNGTYTSARRYVLQSYASGKESVKKRLAPFVTIASCPACHGKRLNQHALSVKFAGYNIAELGELTVTQLRALLHPYAQGTSADLPEEMALREAVIRMSADICRRLDQLDELGLGHLALGRRTTMLSSGELQRIRLATQLISRLFGVLYVLDEPSAGLHPEDVKALMQSLRSLLDAGNSLAIVEHNLDVISEADWLIEVGPGPGRLGGEVVYSGVPAGLANIAASRTAGYLFNQSHSGLRQRHAPDSWLKLAQVSCNNISMLDAAIPLERMTVITGVSGSGKSTLLARVLPALLERLDKTHTDEDKQEEDVALEIKGKIISGAALLQRLVRIDQRPIGRTPRSNLATYTGFFDTVRKLFAETEEAKRRGFDASRFSFNLPAGRCPVCEGQGQIIIELLFMPEASAPCSTCGGTRYNEETLAVRWENRTIADVLDLTVDDAVEAFKNNPSIQRSLTALTALGLGYLKLGQPATELSGGECQRIKLAWELQRVQRGKTLYLLDEPSSGLHPSDMDKLMRVLDQLVQRGNTVVMAEHDMRIASEADWVIDLGPGSGVNGGRIVAAGTPEEVSQSAQSLTAPWLARQLQKRVGDPQ